MQVSMTREGDTAARAVNFKLPTDVEVGNDGKTLVDNRSFYQTRLTGNSTISTLQGQFNTAEKAKADAAAKNEGYSLMTPFNFVGGIVSSVFAFLGTMVSSILGICGYGGEEAAPEAGKEQTNDAKKA